MDEGAFVGDVENGVDASDTETEADEPAQLDDLFGAEVSVHAIKQLGAHFCVGHGEPLGELNRQAFAVGQRVNQVVLVDGCVLGFGDDGLRSRRSSSVQSNGTGVDLSDPHSGQLLLSDRQSPVVEHGL
ncbi:MAG: hypothetical protein ACKVIQ_10660 [Acidimicrobiales bacterium]